MAFAYVEAGDVVRLAAQLPNAARIVGSRAWVHGLAGASVEIQQACGWFAVTDTPKPADTATTTHDRTVELVDSVPVVAWVGRPWAADEIAARNGDTIRSRALEALEVNRAFLLTPSPTAAQTLAQVRSMARQMNGLIRLTLGQLDGTD